jgi:hypothetical protein
MQKIPTRTELGLTVKEYSLLKKLSTPIKIQDFLDSLPKNLEKKGETYHSPRVVLRENKAHCFEGALLACVSLWIQGQKPLLLDLKTEGDIDHILALYKINGYWGAISKHDGTTLRFRDPVYKTTRELALSYFHEYFNVKTRKKTLRSYSKTPLDLSTFGTSWITSEEKLFDIVKKLDWSAHTSLLPTKNKKYLRKADNMEMRASEIEEWEKSDPRT